MSEVTLYSTGKKREVREKLFNEQEGLCGYCFTECFPPNKQSYNGDEKHRSFVLDHKIPVARGGTNFLSNIIGTCWLCNAKKRRMTDEEFFQLMYMGSTNFDTSTKNETYQY